MEGTMASSFSEQATPAGPIDKRSSTLRGLSWDKKFQCWRARIYYSGKQRHIGRYTDHLTAARAYDKAAVYLYGNSAHTNFGLESCKQDPTEVSSYIIKAKQMVEEQAKLQGSSWAGQPRRLPAHPPAGMRHAGQAQVMFSTGPGQQQVLQAQHAGQAQMLACAPTGQLAALAQMPAQAQHAGQAQIIACAPLPQRAGQAQMLACAPMRQQQDILQRHPSAQAQYAAQAQVMYSSSPGQQQDMLQAHPSAQAQYAGQAQYARQAQVMHSSSPGQQQMLLQAPAQLQHAGQQASHMQLLSSAGPGRHAFLQLQFSAQALQQPQQAGQAQLLACAPMGQPQMLQQTGHGLMLSGTMAGQHMVQQQVNSTELQQGSGTVWPQEDLSQQHQQHMFALGPATDSSALSAQASSTASQIMLASSGSPMYAAASAPNSSSTLNGQLNMVSGSPTGTPLCAAGSEHALLHNTVWQSSQALHQQQQLQEELFQQQAGYTMQPAATQAQQQQQMGQMVFTTAAQEQQLLQQAGHMPYSAGPQQYLPDQQQAMVYSAGTHLPQQQSAHAGTAVPACAPLGWNIGPSQLTYGSLSMSNNLASGQQVGGTAGLQTAVSMQSVSLPMAHTQLGGIAAAASSLDGQLQGLSLPGAMSCAPPQQQQQQLLVQMT